ncbi:MAG: glycosyltransferase family 2 protein [Nitrospinae bacterium]|nr:glycosyltransferase family 2 protein [Nitrospinota bacterium]
MISVVVPVYNEENGIGEFLIELKKSLEAFPGHEIIVVNDGSTDGTAEKVRTAGIPGLKLMEHPENLGYGKSLYDGIAACANECVAIIDGDGSYPPSRFADFYRNYPAYDMVVGARQGWEYKKGFFKRPARMVFKALAEYAAGRNVPDINSGMRMFKRSVLLRFKDSLCAGFSFTTTMTLFFMLNSHPVLYLPVEYRKREGSSKVRPLRDTLRALQYIIEAILFYNPLKLFLLVASICLVAGGLLVLLDILVGGNLFMSALAALLIGSFPVIFSMGLLANQLRKIYISSGGNNN